MSGLFDLLFLALVVWWIFRSIGQSMGGETGEGTGEGSFDLEDVLRGRTRSRGEGPRSTEAERAGASPRTRDEGEGGADDRERFMASIRDEISRWEETGTRDREAASPGRVPEAEDRRAPTEEARPGWVRRAEARLQQRARERELARASEPGVSAEVPGGWRLERSPRQERGGPVRSGQDVSPPRDERPQEAPEPRTPVGGPLAAGEIGSGRFPEAADRRAGDGIRPGRPSRPTRPGGTGSGGTVPSFPDRSPLERAILYREILGPPRALSPWDTE